MYVFCGGAAGLAVGALRQYAYCTRRYSVLIMVTECGMLPVLKH